jgi:hypothetical protein
MDNLENYWVFELATNPDRFEDLKSLMADMVEATQKSEVGALNYEWATSDDRRVCHVFERYQDSTAVMTRRVVRRELCRAINGSGSARTPGCLWQTKRTGEGGSGRVEPPSTWRLSGTLHGNEFDSARLLKMGFRVHRCPGARNNARAHGSDRGSGRFRSSRSSISLAPRVPSLTAKSSASIEAPVRGSKWVAVGFGNYLTFGGKA